MAAELNDKKDELDLLEDARKVFRKGDKHGVRTVALMNRIYDIGHKIRSKQQKEHDEMTIQMLSILIPKEKKEE